MHRPSGSGRWSLMSYIGVLSFVTGLNPVSGYCWLYHACQGARLAPTKRPGVSRAARLGFPLYAYDRLRRRGPARRASAGWEAGQPKPHTLRSATLTFSWSASDCKPLVHYRVPKHLALSARPPARPRSVTVAPGGTPGRGRLHPLHNKDTGTKSCTKKAKTVPKTAGFCGLFGIVWWGMYRWGVVYICVWVVLWCVDTGLG